MYNLSHTERGFSRRVGVTLWWMDSTAKEIYSMRDYLVYTSAGATAKIRRWHRSATRNYDIWVTNYSGIPSLNKQYSDFYNERQGSKYENLLAVFHEHRELLAQYKAIMVADDDLIISPTSLSALFNILEENDLWLLQPAFSGFGKTSHKITKRQLFSALRYTNFIEMNCPIFRTDKLFDFLSIYQPEITSDSGIDFWYLHTLGMDHPNRYAISDRYTCINTRDFFKPGGRREINILNSDHERSLQRNAVQNKLGLSGLEYKEYQKIHKSLLEGISSIPLFILETSFDHVFSFFSRLKKKLRAAPAPDETGAPIHKDRYENADTL